MLLEQSSGPAHKVCGEFLSAEAAVYLGELGVELGRLGALPIRGLQLSTGRSQIATEIPFPAFSLSRLRLDEELLAQALHSGAVVQRGQRVESLTRQSGVWHAVLTNGFTVKAGAAFLATGKHDLRGHPRPNHHTREFVAFKMYWRLDPSKQRELEQRVELHFFPGGYAGLQLNEKGEANLCVVVRWSLMRQCGSQWPVLLQWILRHAEPLAHRLDGASSLFQRPLAISSIPYGLLRVRSDHGLWLLGDQTAVIPSFAGDGISIALHSARMACESFCGNGTPDDLARIMHRQLKRPFHIAAALAFVINGVPEITGIARLWPQVLQIVANETRIPRTALFLPSIG
jgi:flavin-dependent dehydrogenase